MFSKLNNINNYTKRNTISRGFRTRKIYFVVISERHISIFILYLPKTYILVKIKNDTNVQPRPGLAPCLFSPFYCIALYELFTPNSLTTTVETTSTPKLDIVRFSPSICITYIEPLFFVIKPAFTILSALIRTYYLLLLAFLVWLNSPTLINLNFQLYTVAFSHIFFGI